MYQIEQVISPLLESQFPEFYQTEGPNFIAFVKAYYEWMELEGNTLNVSRNILNYRDVDTSISAFAEQFKNEYLNSVPALTSASKPVLIKHIQDLYRSKGAVQSYQLLFKLLFDEDIDIYTPSTDVIRASDGEWVLPYYLEVDRSDRAITYVGKQVSGSVTGATAFVESVSQKRINGRFVTVIYLSNIAGDFQTGELVTENGILENAPKVTGSLTNILISEGGANNKVGDVFNVVSNTGLLGQAKVTAVVDGTGKVSFTLVDGGTGYTSSANVYVSNTVVFLEKKKNSSTYVTLGSSTYAGASYVLDFINNYYLYGSTNTAVSSVDAVAGYNFTRTIGGAGMSYASYANGILTSFANNVPRITDLGILIEGAGQNRLLQSQNTTSTSWTKGAIISNSSMMNTSIAPDLTMTADKIVANTESGASVEHYIRQTVTGWTAGANLTFSTFVKGAEKTSIRLRLLDSVAPGNGFFASFDTSNGSFAGGSGVSGTTSAISTITMKSLPNNWWRVSVTGVISSTATSAIADIFIMQGNTSSSTLYVGDSTSGVYIWGPQIENFSFVSSYVPTTTAAVARSKESFYFNNVDVLGSGDWTIQTSATNITSNLFGSSATLFSINDGSGNSNAINLLIASGNSTANFQEINNGTSIFNASTSTVVIANNKTQVAVTKNSTAIRASATANAAKSIGTWTTPTYSTNNLLIGYLGIPTNGASFLNGYLKNFVVYPAGVTDTRLVTLGTIPTSASSPWFTISFSNISPYVTGNVTTFDTSLAVGGGFYFSNGFNIGYINSITNSTYLTLDSNSTIAYSGNAVFYSGNTTPDFEILETVKQPLTSFQYFSGVGNTALFKVGAALTGYYANNSQAANGFVVAYSNTSGTAGTVVISVVNGSFLTATSIAVSSNTLVNAQASGNTLDISATGVVIGSNTATSRVNGASGLVSINKTLYANGAILYGVSSNTFSNTVSKSTGTLAKFSVGTISGSETLTLFTDLIGANNSANVPFSSIKLDGSNSGVLVATGTGTITCNTATNAVTGIGSSFLADLSAVNFSNGGVISTFSNTTVTGSGTSFNTQLLPGYILYYTANSTIIGTVSSITSATSLKLTTAAPYTATSVNMTFSKGNIVPISIYASNGYYLGTVNTVTSATALTLTANASANLVSGVYQYSYGGYGFPKSPQAGLYNLLSDVLNVNTFTLGTIASLTAINPGIDYNADPFVLVRDNVIAGFNRKNFNIGINNLSGSFNAGDTITQQLSQSGVSFSVGTTSGTYANGTITCNTATANVTGVGTTFTTLVSNGYAIYANGVFAGTVASVTNNTLLILSGSSVTNAVSNGFTYASNTSFITSEGIYQPSTNALGTVSAYNAGSMQLTNIIGTFSTGQTIIGLASKLRANISTAITTTTATSYQKGTVLSSNNTNLYVQRTLFNTSFSPGVAVYDANSAASANIVSATQDNLSAAMGTNALVTAKVKTAVGIATSVEVIASGYGYDQTTQTWETNISYNIGSKVYYSGDGLYYVATQNVPLTAGAPSAAPSYWTAYTDVELVSTGNNAYVIAGNALIEKQGKGVGYWKNNKGKLNSDKYIHDNYYYQEFSYEVQAGRSIDKYSDILQQLLHVSGTQMFGRVIKSSNLDVPVYVPSSTITIKTDSSPTLDFSYTDNSMYIPLLVL